MSSYHDRLLDSHERLASLQFIKLIVCVGKSEQINYVESTSDQVAHVPAVLDNEEEDCANENAEEWRTVVRKKYNKKKAEKNIYRNTKNKEITTGWIFFVLTTL